MVLSGDTGPAAAQPAVGARNAVGWRGPATSRKRSPDVSPQPPTYDDRPARSGRFGELLLAAALAGLLVAGLLLPLVGGLGLAAKGSADSFQDLPSELQVPPLAQASRILAVDGSTMASFYYENRINVSLRQVPKVMRNAIIAIEDSRFYEHHGIDIRGIVRAAVTNRQAGEIQQGGSTLTQQYVKNILLESATSAEERAAAKADTLTRKLREARYAIALEQRWSKNKILEGYLNIAYFGSGAYGVAAAARHYFGKPVNRLNLPEAALLGGIVRSPFLYDPILHPQTAKARRNTVLQRMADLGLITPSQATRAENAKIGLHVTKPTNGCVGSVAPFFCKHIIEELKRDRGLGQTVNDRIKLLLRGGLTIRTSLDPKIQRSARKAVLKHTDVADHVAAVADVVEPGTGLVKAMAVNRIYGPQRKRGYTEVNLATGGQAGVQGGSTFKIFTLTAALEEGIPLDLRLRCPPRYTSPVFKNGDGTPYSVGNAEASEGGSFDLVSATALSVNTCFVQLEERTGVDRPVRIAQSMGVKNVDGRPLNRGGSFTLGTDSVSPLDMAAVYATYAAHGKYCPPTAVLSVTDSRHRAYPVSRPACRQVMDKGVADTVTSVLEKVIAFGTGTGAAIPRPAAGKTGTAQGLSAAWFDGFVPQLAAAVWLGDPRGGFQHPLQDIRIGKNFYARVYGGTIAAPIWGDLMHAALKHVPKKGFAAADPILVHGRQVTVPYVKGLSLGAAKDKLAAAGLTGVFEGQEVAAGGVAGTVAYTYPQAGYTIGLGSSVVIVLTNGKTKPSPSLKLSPSPSPSPSPTSTPKPKPTKSPKPKPSFTLPPR